MRSSLLAIGCLVGACLALPASLRAEEGKEPEVPAGLRGLIERLAAAAPPGPPALADVYDLDALAGRARLVAEAWQGAAAPPADPVRDAAWRAGAVAAVEAIERDGDMPAFTQHRVLRWGPAVGGQAGELSAAIFAGDQVWTLRMWVSAAGPDGAWRLVDSDFPMAGIRDSMLVSHHVAPGVLPEAERVSRQLKALRPAEALLDEDRPAEALAQIEGLLTPGARGTLAAYLQQRRVFAALAAGRGEVAAEALAAARALDASMGAPDWLEARVLEEAQEDDRGALRALAAHQAAFGDEIRGLRARLRLLEGQDRAEQALALAVRGATLYPRFYDFAGACLRLLPEGRRAEALPYLRAVDDIGDALEEAIDPDDPLASDAETLEVATQAFVQKAPEHARRPLHEAARQARVGDLAAARETIRLAFWSIPEDAPREPLRRLLVRLPWLQEAQQTPEAFRDAVVSAFTAAAPADRAWVFSGLAYELGGGEDDLALEALLKAARDAGGVGPDLGYYDAELAWMRGDLEATLAALERLGTPAVPEEGHPRLETVLGYWPLELRVRALVRLGRAQEALAPARACFVRLHDAHLLAIAHAHLGNEGAVERAFEHEQQRGIDLQDLFEDDDLHDVLQRDAFTALRERFNLR